MLSMGGIIGVVIAIIVVLVVVCVISWWIKTKNRFVTYQVKIEEAKSGIDVALEKRFDLLTKMFDITKGYAKHEKETLADVIGLRNGIPRDGSMKEKAEISNKLTQAANDINVIFERYPELKANTLFLELQNSSRDAEEHLQASRRSYNSNVSIYNQALVVFPSSIIANHYRFEKAEFFETTSEKRQDVKMNF